MHALRTSVLGLFLITLFISCSTPEKTATTTEAPDAEPVSIYPDWYNDSGFTADSLSYTAYHSSIAADSAEVMQSAEDFARNKLESRLAEKLEAVRTELASQGNNIVQQRDFIILLRNAHQQIVTVADLTASESAPLEEGEGYRGFAGVEISKSALKELLQSEFEGYNSYWNTFGESEAFKDVL